MSIFLEADKVKFSLRRSEVAEKEGFIRCGGGALRVSNFDDAVT